VRYKDSWQLASEYDSPLAAPAPPPAAAARAGPQRTGGKHKHLAEEARAKRPETTRKPAESARPASLPSPLLAVRPKPVQMATVTSKTQRLVVATPVKSNLKRKTPAVTSKTQRIVVATPLEIKSKKRAARQIRFSDVVLLSDSEVDVTAPNCNPNKACAPPQIEQPNGKASPKLRRQKSGKRKKPCATPVEPDEGDASSDSKAPPPSRKRVAKPETRKRNTRLKTLVVSEKSPCSCTQKCFQRIGRARRKDIRIAFQKLDNAQQKEHMAGLIDLHKVVVQGPALQIHRKC
jgi:hypothetical protein